MNDVKAFVELLNTDKTYQEKFEVAAKAYKGEITDEAIWEAVIGPLAADAGYDITFDDYKAYVEGFTKNNEMSLDELGAVAGGFSACFLLGFGSKPETGNGKVFSGVETGYEDWIGACAYVGVGWGAWGME